MVYKEGNETEGTRKEGGGIESTDGSWRSIFKQDNKQNRHNLIYKHIMLIFTPPPGGLWL